MAGKRVRLMASTAAPARARPPRRLARNESASARRVSTLTQQPHPLAEALDSNRWRLALCFGYFHLCQQMKVTRPAGRDRRAASQSDKFAISPQRAGDHAV